MAVFNVSCPQCATGYKMDEVHRGMNVKCKKVDCGAAFVFKERPRGEDGIPLDWEPGDVILDLYEVMKLPGTKHGYVEGGMGRVNLVRHREWQKALAVKSVLPAKSASIRDIEHFKTEAEQWVDKIGLHPNIVACHYVRVLGGVPRVFIEYVDGGTLQHWITSKQLYEGGPNAALEQILDVAIQTAWGLHYVHELGLIHQDVKPLNVMLTADGVAKVTDFGLAGARSVAFDNNDKPSAGQTMLATGGGMTPPYCSPEQADIAAKKEARIPKEQWPKLTRRTDLWSWAVSVLEMFLGERPWGDKGQTAFLHVNKESDDALIPAMPDAVRDLLRHCFQRAPEDRPHDLMQVADTLQIVYQEETGQPYPREMPKPTELLANTRNNQAVSLIDLKKQDAAEKRWQEALGLDPHHLEATYNWGLIQWRSVRITDQKLLQKLREVRSSSADPARVDYLLGLVHLERGDAQAAVQLLSKALVVATDRAEITSALALAQSLSDSSEQLSRTFEGHMNGVNSVSWSHGGIYALSGSMDKTLRLWEVSSGKCLRIFQGHTETVNPVSWSPDDRYVLSGSEDKTLRLWEVSSGKCLRSFRGHTRWVESVSWSPDGRFALSGSYDRTMRLWEVSSGKCLRTFEGHKSNVTSVSWSSDARFALSGCGDNKLRLWEVSSGKCLRILEGHTNHVTSVAWSPDGMSALSASDDHTLRLWDVSFGRCLRSFEGHMEMVKSVSWSFDGRFALSGSNDNTVRLWEVFSGRCLRTFEGHTGWVKSVSWSPDARFALSGSYDKAVQLWMITIAKQRVPLVTSMAIAYDSALYHRLLQEVRSTLTSNPAGAATLLQNARQQPGCSRREEALSMARQLSHSLAHRSFVEGWEKRTFEGHTKPVTSVSWSPDGRYALSGSWDQTLRLWDVLSGKCMRTFKGHKSRVTSVAWSPDGCRAVSGSNDKTLRQWEVSSGKCLSIEHYTDWVYSVSCSPDGRYALSGSVIKTSEMEKERDWVTSVAWNRDGRYALLGCTDRTMRLWEPTSGRCLRGFEGHKFQVQSVSWSPDGRLAISGSRDTTLRLWEVSSGKCLHTFEGHNWGVYSVSWSPDGRFALSGSYDKTLRLWEVSSGKCLRVFEDTNRVTSVSWSPDGRFALSGSFDNTVRLWELDWEFEPNQPADWDEGARPHLLTFLSLHTPLAKTLSGGREPTAEELTLSLTRRGKATWTEEAFRRLLDTLGCAGYGWLRPEGVRRELEKMAATWQGPQPLL